MLREFGHLLLDQVRQQPPLRRFLDRLRGEGCRIRIVLENPEEGLKEEIELLPEPPSKRMPVFQITGKDLSFLRSIGIDPTRRGKRRRSS